MTLKCRSCGCTNDRACPGGCSWVSIDPPICSACVSDDEAFELGFAGMFGDISEPQPEDAPLCNAGPVPAPHKPIFTSAEAGYCAACKKPFFATEAA
ncbi:hypothetical protein [Rhodopseudomonas sp. BR0G17]|uniref:hypothetical protein n=1 Tax=Rhodopseudomonas sp. BR0G17 TaxID=2269368 RepID=UPI0013E01B58|nr:hypothetical protein [Rhodopseudomonas sp. BR0G17]NEW95525.1 hypothetical protein [Rhodopseudomonas sp. BR0G17]